MKIEHFVAIFVSFCCVFCGVEGLFHSLARSSLKIQSRTNVAAVGSPIWMNSRLMSSRGSTITKIDTRIAQKTRTKPTYKEEIDKNWRLVLHDDTIHTIEHVCSVIERHVPLCPGARAYEVTLEVHMTGQATVCVSNKKLIEEYTKRLQSEGLTVSMAPDDDFEGDDGNDESQDA